MREFEAQYEAAGRAIKALEEFQAQIVHDQKQVSELQRLAEERQRKELAEWQAENEQRWKKETLRWDYDHPGAAEGQPETGRTLPAAGESVALLQRELEAFGSFTKHWAGSLQPRSCWSHGAAQMRAKR